MIATQATGQRTLLMLALTTCFVHEVSAGVVLAGDSLVSTNGAFKTLIVGATDGSSGSAVVSAPGPDYFSLVAIGDGATGRGQGSMTVSGAGASLIATGAIGVGTKGAGSLLINNGGSVLSMGGQSEFCATGCNSTTIANGGGSSGTVTVSGIGSAFITQDGLNDNGGLLVGNGTVNGTFGRPNEPTNGFLYVLNGATASTTFARLGVSPMGNGTVQVTGPGSNWTVNPTAVQSAFVQVGYGGSGALGVSNGGTVNAKSIVLGLLADASGNLNVTGAGSKVKLSAQDAGAVGPSLLVGSRGSGNAQVFDGGQILLDSNGRSGSVSLGASQTGAGYLDVYNGSKVSISGTGNRLTVANGRLNISKNSIVDVANGAGSTGSTTVGASTNGTIDINNSILNAGTTLRIASNTAGSGTVLLHGSSVLSATNILIGANGLLGGQGAINGNITNNGGTLQVGASPDALTVHGALAQVGGEIHFEVDPDAHGGFLNSTLIFDTDETISINGARIFFDFVGGADPLAFMNAGLLDINTFFKTNTGLNFSEQFGLNSVFGGDQFVLIGFDISGFDPVSGRLSAIASVPEPSSWLLFAAAMLAMVLRKRGIHWRRSGIAKSFPKR